MLDSFLAGGERLCLRDAIIAEIQARASNLFLHEVVYVLHRINCTLLPIHLSLNFDFFFLMDHFKAFHLYAKLFCTQVVLDLLHDYFVRVADHLVKEIFLELHPGCILLIILSLVCNAIFLFTYQDLGKSMRCLKRKMQNRAAIVTDIQIGTSATTNYFAFHLHII